MIALAQAAEWLVRRIGEIMAWSGLALVLVVAFDVIARYALDFGSVGMQESEWHLMAVGALFGMSYGLNQGEEVRVDVLYAGYSPRAKLAVDTTAALLLALVALAVVWLSIGFVERSYLMGEGSADPGGLPGRWLLKGLIPAAFLLVALQSLAQFVLRFGRLFGAGPAER